ncbi:mucin-5AC-like [Bacillus rossius redtenbacheri]|uniref:mucin-5AC-like n=1 Tax=Bacillus rossius redtenbacheri TaxID=93214 RepID=UPI002FDCDCAC
MTPSVLAGVATLLLAASIADCRAVGINNTWFLPQEGFPVFYRYFRDLITWYEADAVCQFHHANLVTVDSSEQFDTSRAFLKELDVTSNVWIGLKRGKKEENFSWTSMSPLELRADGGYFLEAPPASDTPLCVASDPGRDYRWRSFGCGGPQVATFICELPVPRWASSPDGCLLTSLPSLTVTFLPEQAAVELTSDCGLDGTRRIACKGPADRDEMMKQLSCASEDAAADVTWTTDAPAEAAAAAHSSAPAQPWTADEPPTRQRRDASHSAGPRDAPTAAYDSSSSSSQAVDLPPSPSTSTPGPAKSTEGGDQNVTSTAAPSSELTSPETAADDLAAATTPPAAPRNSSEADRQTTAPPRPRPVAAVEAGKRADEEEDHAWTELPSGDTAEDLGAEPEAPARPNRGRRLTRPQGRSFYPYFLNRVLG